MCKGAAVAAWAHSILHSSSRQQRGSFSGELRWDCSTQLHRPALASSLPHHFVPGMNEHQASSIITHHHPLPGTIHPHPPSTARLGQACSLQPTLAAAPRASPRPPSGCRRRCPGRAACAHHDEQPSHHCVRRGSSSSHAGAGLGKVGPAHGAAAR